MASASGSRSTPFEGYWDHGDPPTVYLSGEVDLNTHDQFAAVLDEAASPGRDLVIDCTKLTYIDVAGIRIMVRAAPPDRRRAAQTQGRTRCSRRHHRCPRPRRHRAEPSPGHPSSRCRRQPRHFVNRAARAPVALPPGSPSTRPGLWVGRRCRRRAKPAGLGSVSVHPCRSCRQLEPVCVVRGGGPADHRTTGPSGGSPMTLRLQQEVRVPVSGPYEG